MGFDCLPVRWGIPLGGRLPINTGKSYTGESNRFASNSGMIDTDISPLNIELNATKFNRIFVLP